MTEATQPCSEEWTPRQIVAYFAFMVALGVILGIWVASVWRW